jgi:hypothetical protein
LDPNASSANKEQLVADIISWLQNEFRNNYDLKAHELSKLGEIDATTLFIQPDSLRLRSLGNRVLKTYFDHETFTLDRPLSVNQILQLSKHLNSPFFIYEKQGATTLTLFGHEQIVLCKMAGSVTLWLDNIS